MTATGTLGVVGLGLIGGSVALDAHAAGWPLLATDTDADQRAAAAAAGIAVTEDLTAIARGTDLVVVATPAPQVAEVLRALDTLADGPVLATTVASVQSPDVLGIDTASLRYVRHVGGHPMTGTERSGFRAARRGMFDGSPWIVTPRPGDDVAAFRTVVELASALGAVPAVLSPEEHDRTVALLSHLPHVLAYTAYGQLQRPDGSAAEQLAGGSFRDATRVAATRPSFWAEVLHLNRAAVADVVADVVQELTGLLAVLRDGADVATLEAALARGHRAVGRPRPVVPPATPLPSGALDAATIATLERHTLAGLAIETVTDVVAWTAP